MVTIKSIIMCTDSKGGIKQYSKSIRRDFVSISITLLIVLMLIISGPASAVHIKMKPPSDHAVGEAVTFTIDIRLLGSDFINIQNINVTNLPLGNISFYPDGTMISGDSGYTITRIGSTYYGYGYGYGYDENPGYGYGYDFGYGYGYGYGYEYGHSVDGPRSSLKYYINISGLPVGTYTSKDVQIDVFVAGNPDKPAFSVVENYNFRIKTKPTITSKNSGGTEISESLMQTHMLFNGIAIFWDNIARFILSTEIPVATDSVSVELLNTNPTNMGFDGFVFQYIDINAGPNSDRPGTINFRVSTDSLNDADLNPDDVALYRFKNGQWTELHSEWVRNHDDYEEYWASTLGFSSFMIAEKKAMPIAEETTSIEAEQGA